MSTAMARAWVWDSPAGEPGRFLLRINGRARSPGAATPAIARERSHRSSRRSVPAVSICRRATQRLFPPASRRQWVEPAGRPPAPSAAMPHQHAIAAVHPDLHCCRVPTGLVLRPRQIARDKQRHGHVDDGDAGLLRRFDPPAAVPVGHGYDPPFHQSRSPDIDAHRACCRQSRIPAARVRVDDLEEASHCQREQHAQTFPIPLSGIPAGACRKFPTRVAFDRSSPGVGRHALRWPGRRAKPLCPSRVPRQRVSCPGDVVDQGATNHARSDVRCVERPDRRQAVIDALSITKRYLTSLFCMRS